MKRFLVGTLFLATVFACGNAANNGSAAAPNAANATQQTTTTGATTGGRQGSSHDYVQSTVGKGMPGAGDKSSLAGPSSPNPPAPTFAVPREPAPANTGDPCPNCPEHR